MPTQHVTLTEEQTAAFGRELDTLKERVMADLGERDADDSDLLDSRSLDARQSGFDVQIRRYGPIDERIQCVIVQGTPP